MANIRIACLHFMLSVVSFKQSVKRVFKQLLNYKMYKRNQVLMQEYELISPQISAKVVNRSIVKDERYCGEFKTFDVVYLDIVGEILAGRECRDTDSLNACTAIAQAGWLQDNVLGFIYVSKRIDLENLTPYETLILEHEIAHHQLGHTVQYMLMNQQRVSEGKTQLALVVPEFEYAADAQAINKCLETYSKAEMLDAIEQFDELGKSLNCVDQTLRHVHDARIKALVGLVSEA